MEVATHVGCKDDTVAKTVDTRRNWREGLRAYKNCLKPRCREVATHVGCKDDTVAKTVDTRRNWREGLRAYKNCLKPRCREGVVEDCCMLRIYVT